MSDIETKPAKRARHPKSPASEPTPADLLAYADGSTLDQRVAAAMRTGNAELVARVRAAGGR